MPTIVPRWHKWASNGIIIRSIHGTAGVPPEKWMRSSRTCTIAATSRPIKGKTMVAIVWINNLPKMPGCDCVIWPPRLLPSHHRRQHQPLQQYPTNKRNHIIIEKENTISFIAAWKREQHSLRRCRQIERSEKKTKGDGREPSARPGQLVLSVSISRTNKCESFPSTPVFSTYNFVSTPVSYYSSRSNHRINKQYYQ